MSSAGMRLVAGRIPGERIATTIATIDSATFTTEVQVMSVTAALVNGLTYRVRAVLAFNSSANGDEALARLREDSIAGTVRQEGRIAIPVQSGFSGYTLTVEFEYTAVATAAKTFVVGGLRASGSGSVRMEAATNRPTYLYVDYISG